MTRKQFLGLTRPSEALTAMCDGLLKAERRKGFGIDMGTFGRVERVEGEEGSGKVCFGCAATCAIQEAANVRFGPENIAGLGRRRKMVNRSTGTRLTDNRLMSFERVMDSARRGYLYQLFSFFGFNGEEALLWMLRWRMDTANWKEQIPAIRKAIREMRKEGF